MLKIRRSHDRLTFNMGILIPGNDGLYIEMTSFEYPKRRLSVRSRKVSKPRDWYLKLSYRFEIWQAHRQHCCQSACQISERSNNSKYKSRGFETLRDLTERRLFGYWDGAQTLAGTPPPGIYHIRCTATSVSTQLCFTVAKHGDWTPLTCSGSTTMTSPWSAGSVAPKIMKKTFSISLLHKLGIRHTMAVFCSWRLRWYWRSVQQHAMSCIRSVTDYQSPSLEGMEDPKRYDLNVWKLMSENVACLALTCKTDTWRAGGSCSVVLPTPSNGTRMLP